MRPELEILKEIESYINNKLSENEKKAFEDKLKLDANLAKEVELQRDIMEGIERVGIKNSVKKAAKMYQIMRVVRFVAFGLLIILTSIFLYLNFQPNSQNNTAEIIKEEIEDFIKPAFNDFNIPFNQFIFNAEIGDTIYYESGSILVFPPNAFLDKDGKLIKGEVKITYRELSDPIDFFISGIPMDYDSNGVKYTFESAGMMEMYGYQNDEPIFVNPQSKPEINLASKTTDNAHNLYYLDTLQRKWINKGKDVISVIDETQESEKTADLTRIESSKNIIPTPPFLLEKPNKPSGKMPMFSIDIEPGSVPELQAYNHLLFEVDKDEKNYDANQSKIKWSDVTVEKSTIKGKYLVTFIKGTKKLTYLTRPVFEGKSYDEALSLFESKKKEYDNLLSKRIEKEKKQKELAENREKENEETSRLNILIEARNKEIDKANGRKARIKQLVMYIESNNPKSSFFSKEDTQEAMVIIEKRKLIQERIERERETQKRIALQNEKIRVLEGKKLDSLAFEEGGIYTENQIYRTFGLEGFGIWNCDNPLIGRGRPLVVDFKDKNNNMLLLNNVTIVIKELNGVFRFNNRFTSIRVFESEMMLLTVQDNKFICLTYDDYKKCNITSETKEYTFKMNVYPDKIKSKEDIKRILEL